MILYKEKALTLVKSDKIIPRIWLIFGSDQASLLELVEKIKNKIYNSTYDFIRFLAKEANLTALFLEKSLFQANNFILLEEVGDFLAKELEEKLHLLGPEDYLILLAEDLKKNSKLRLLLENHPDAAVVNCYKLEGYAFVNEIENNIKERKLQFNREIPAIIAQEISQELLKKELDKIELFLAGRGEKTITESLLMQLLIRKPEASLDKVFSTIVLKKDKDFCREMNKILLNEVNPIFFLRSLQNFLQRLIEVQSKFGQMGKEAALSSLNPPLFGEAKRIFLEIAQKSDIKSNIELFERSFNAEKAIKETSLCKPLEIIYQFFLQDVTGFNR
jgi:DNA polymerase III delta subunit